MHTMRLIFIQDVLRVLFQRKLLFHYDMKVHCFAGCQNVTTITILLQGGEIEYLLLWRVQFEMRIKQEY
jgi:hypothetical protein